MIKAKLKHLSLIMTTLIAVCVLSFAVGCSTTNEPTVKTSYVDLVVGGYEESYSSATEFTLESELIICEQGGSFTTTEGETVTAEEKIVAKNPTVTFPSGTTYTAGKHVLSEEGKYTIRYFYTYKNVEYVAVKDFTVCGSLFNLSVDNGSEIVKSQVEDEAGNHNTWSGKEGIIAKLVSGSEFVYNKPINLTKGKSYNVNGVETTLSSIIDFDPRSGRRATELEYGDNGHITWNEGDYDMFAEYCEVILTDCYDPSVFVKIHFRRKGPSGQPQLFVSSNTQSPWGIYWGNTRTVNVGGTVVLQNIDGKLSGTYPMGYSFGAPAFYYSGTTLTYIPSILGRRQRVHPTTGAILDPYYKLGESYELLYDNDRNRVYLVVTNLNDGTQQYINPFSPVNDLESQTIYGDNLFGGFTTGEVNLTVKFNNYLAGEANVEIYSVGESTTQDLIANLDEKKYVDSVKPIINVDVTPTVKPGADDVNSAGTIFSAMGGTVTIPKAKVIDANSTGAYKVAVYRGYNTKNQFRVDVKNDIFYTSVPDIYTIVYTAEDLAGNVGTTTLTVNVKPTQNKRAVSLLFNENQLNTFLSNPVTTGAKNVLPEYSLSTINTTSSLKCSIVAYNEFERIEIDPTTRIFAPRYNGKYTIEMTYSDNVFVYQDKYNVNSVAQEGVVSFLDMPHLLKYYIKNATYSLEEVYAYSYSDKGPKEHKPEVYVIYDGNEADAKLVKDISKFKVEGNKTLQFKFVYSKNGVEAEPAYSQVAKIKDVGFGLGKGTTENPEKFMLYKYFDYDESLVKVETTEIVTNSKGEQVEKELKDIVYQSKKGSGDFKLSLINPINYNTFRLKYKVDDTYGLFEKLRLTLTQANDETKKFVMDFYILEDKSVISLNGGAPITLSGFDFTSKSIKDIQYVDASRKLFLGAKNVIPCEFGFTNSLIYFDIEVLGISGNAGVLVNQVNNQAFNGTKHVDEYAPEIALETAQGQYELGDIITISPVSFADVLSPIDYSTLQFSIKAPDGTYVTALDGTVLNSKADYTKSYQFKIESSGNYNASWQIYDISCKTKAGKMSYVVECVDVTPPTVLFTDGRNEDTIIQISMEEKVKVDIVIDDGEGSPADKCIVYVHAMYIDTNQIFPNLDKEFNLRRTGDWRIFVVVHDENMNMTTRSFVVRVV